MLRSQTFSDPEKVKLSESKSMSADLVTTNVWKPISHHARWRLYIGHVYYIDDNIYIDISIYIDTNTHHPQTCLHVMHCCVKNWFWASESPIAYCMLFFDSPVRQAQKHYISQGSKMEQNKMAQTVSSHWNILGTCNRTIWNHLEHTGTYVV